MKPDVCRKVRPAEYEAGYEDLIASISESDHSFWANVTQRVVGLIHGRSACCLIAIATLVVLGIGLRHTTDMTGYFPVAVVIAIFGGYAIKAETMREVRNGEDDETSGRRALELGDESQSSRAA